MGLVTIRTFENGPEAHLFKTKLLSLGIECFIFDEQTITINPIMGVAIGGIKLKVNEIDYEKSNQIGQQWGVKIGEKFKNKMKEKGY